MEAIIVVDVAVVVGRDLVLIRRAKPPFEDRLVLPGGHVEESDASLAAAAARELREETGIEVRADELRLLTVLSAPGRDPRPGRRASVVFAVDLASAERLAGAAPSSDAAELVVRPIAGLADEEIGFDHALAVNLLKGEKS